VAPTSISGSRSRLQPIEQPRPATAAPNLPLSAPPTDEPTGTEAGNVSSAQLDQQEISDIAAELKKGLGAKPVNEPAAAGPQPGSTPAEGTLHIKPQADTPKAPVQAPDDTIYIDNEGMLRATDQAAETSPKP
jgi:hypothetical protein